MQVYVGNLVPGKITKQNLEFFFNQTMATVFPKYARDGMQAVLNVNMHSEGKYAFVELRDPELATAALELNGVQLLTVQLNLGRPASYVAPEQAALHLSKMEEAMNAGTGAKEDSSMSSYLCLENLVSASVLSDDREYAEVIEDIQSECSKHSPVLKVLIPKESRETVKAYVRFGSPAGAPAAQKAIDGRFFDGNTVTASCITDSEWRSVEAKCPS